MDEELLPGERIDDLQLGGLRLIQSANGFRFGMDAVLLSDFTRLRPRERAADLGTGTGILPLLLSQKQPDVSFAAIELQPQMAEMARRSVALNHLEDRISVFCDDLRNAATLLGPESLHAVVCNPPYGKRGSILPSRETAQGLARHETDITIEEILKSCGAILRHHGRLSMVFPAARLLELCDAMRRFRIEPKRLRMVSSKAENPPYLVLAEGMKNARPGLLWLPPLIVYDAHGRETPEIDRIYHRAL